MKTIIQIIGLPASGKTTAVNRYIQKHNNIAYIDIRNFNGKNRIKNYTKAISQSKHSVLAESACGVKLRNSVIIHWDVPIHILYSRYLRREQVLDEDYLSLLKTEMLPAQYSVNDYNALEQLLNTLIEK